MGALVCVTRGGSGLCHTCGLSQQAVLPKAVELLKSGMSVQLGISPGCSVTGETDGEEGNRDGLRQEE